MCTLYLLQNNDGGKKKKKKKNKALDTKLYSNAGGPFTGESVFVRDSRFKVLDNQSGVIGTQLLALQNKQRSNSLDTNHTDRGCGVKSSHGGDLSGTKIVMKGLSRKPPQSQSSKTSPKLAARNCKFVTEQSQTRVNDCSSHGNGTKTKGHRRQRSLPKQHYIETVGEDCYSKNRENVAIDPWCLNPWTKGDLKKSVSLPESGVPLQCESEERSNKWEKVSSEQSTCNGHDVGEMDSFNSLGYTYEQGVTSLDNNHLTYMFPAYDSNILPNKCTQSKTRRTDSTVNVTKHNNVNGHSNKEFSTNTETLTQSESDNKQTHASVDRKVAPPSNWRKVFGLFK